MPDRGLPVSVLRIAYGAAILIAPYAALAAPVRHVPELGVLLILAPVLAGAVAAGRGAFPVLQSVLAVVVGFVIIIGTSTITDPESEITSFAAPFTISFSVAGAIAWGISLSRRPPDELAAGSVGFTPTYCPYCGYITGAGVCSECGNRVYEIHLLRRAPNPRRHRLIIGVLLAGVLISGWFFVQSAPFIRWCPTRVLLAAFRYLPRDARIEREFVRRSSAALFTQTEADDILSIISQPPSSLLHPPRIPVACPIPIAVTGAEIESIASAIFPSHSATVEDEQVVVDGKPVIAVRWPPAAKSIWSGATVLPPQTPGEHTLTLAANYVIRSAAGGSVLSRRPFVLTRTFTVETFSITELVARMDGKSTDVEVRLVDAPGPRSFNDCLFMKRNEQSAPLAGDLYVRKAGTDPWIRISAVCRSTSEPLRIPLDTTHYSCDVRYVPVIEYAWAAGYDRFCASTLEWTDVRAIFYH